MHPLSLVVLLLTSWLYARAAASPVQRDLADGRWVTTWTAAPQPVDSNTQPPELYDDGVVFANASIRQTIRLSIGAERFRFRFSNAFGLRDLPITKITIAHPVPHAGRNETGSHGIDLNTIHTITFSGQESVLLPPAALAVSDPVPLDVANGQALSITIYLRDGFKSDQLTAHPISRTDTYLSLGDNTQSADWDVLWKKSRQGWYFLSGVEAWRPSNFRALILLGDSLTDGSHSSFNADARWPNVLFNRMQAAGVDDISVLNQGAAGNRELTDGTGGKNAVSRIDRDVLAYSSLAYAFMFEGINDINFAGGSSASQNEVAERLISSYQQTITRLHAFGVPVFMSTIGPFACTHPGAKYREAIREQTRLRVNDWIRSSGWPDAVVDFDVVLRDTNNQTEFNPNLDSGDCIHPNDEGYRLMAEAFPLQLFDSFKYGVSRVAGPAEREQYAAARFSSNAASTSYVPSISLSTMGSVVWFIVGFACCALVVTLLPYTRKRSPTSWWSAKTYQAVRRASIASLDEGKMSALSLSPYPSSPSSPTGEFHARSRDRID